MLWLALSLFAEAGMRAPDQPPSPWWPASGATGVPYDLPVWVQGGSVGGPGSAGPRFFFVGGSRRIEAVYRVDGMRSSLVTYGYGVTAARMEPVEQLAPNTAYTLVMVLGATETPIVSFTTGADPAPPLAAPSAAVVTQIPTGPTPPPSSGPSGSSVQTGSLGVKVELPSAGPWLLRLQAASDYSVDIVARSGWVTLDVTTTGVSQPTCADLVVMDLRGMSVTTLRNICR